MRVRLALLALTLAACGGDSPSDSPDVDAAVDAPRDTGSHDSVTEQDAAPPDVNAIPEPVPEIHLPDLAPPDVAVDVAPEAAAADASPDAGPDAPVDLGAQDTGPLDFGADLTADAAADMITDAPQPPCTQVMGTPPLGLQIVETGFTDPSDLQVPPNDPRLFVVEQGGFIWIIDGGATLPAPFLDLSGVITSPRGNEQGLLGLAFHPGYATNGRFFVYYTDDTGGDIQVSEFGVSMDPDVADPTEISVITIPHPEAANHNGGQLAFGPNDGFLHIAVGDGGNSCDTPTADAQSTMSLRGKILRLDVDTASPYAIPMDNPFAGSLSQANEIWAYGLRNPWRMSFDRETGDLYIGDVGQDEWEEIDVQPAASMGAENYGWVEWEASVCQDGSAAASCNAVMSCTMTGFTFPTHEYPHGLSANCFGVAGSVTGGYVYRGCEMPGYHGTYFYADYCLGTVHSFVYSGGVATNLTDWPSLDATVSTFGQDSLGELYLADHGSGTIYRIVPQ